MVIADFGGDLLRGFGAVGVGEGVVFVCVDYEGGLGNGEVAGTVVLEGPFDASREVPSIGDVDREGWVDGGDESERFAVEIVEA